MRVFVPVEDAPSIASIPMLVPYRCGLTCEHALREPVKSSWGRDSVRVDESNTRAARLKQLADA